MVGGNSEKLTILPFYLTYPPQTPLRINDKNNHLLVYLGAKLLCTYL